MSSKPGTRDKLNQWLEQSASAFEHLIRPRSPKPSSTSTSNQQAVQIPDSLVPGSRPVLSSALLNEQPPPARTHPVLSAPKIRTASKTTILDVPILNQGPTARSPSEPTMSNIPTSHVEVAVADVIQPSQLAPGAESSVALVPISPDSKPTPGADDSFSASSLKNTASAALKLSLTAWRESVGAVPTLRSAIDILLSVIENVPTAVKNHKDYNELALSLVATIRSLASQLSQVTPAQMTEAIVDAKKELESQAKHVKARQERAAAKKYIDVEDDIADIIQCYRRIEALFRRLLSDAILSVWRITYQNLSVANESLKLANKNIVVSVYRLNGYGGDYMVLVGVVPLKTKPSAQRSLRLGCGI
ncbi:hypothetical protein FRC07_015065 [Ceratobasidium sp. 392]|nr:hypothetical protein FRC07_015065 [Ceratobasidium sp. 392]